jgi:hypothetical protein
LLHRAVQQVGSPQHHDPVRIGVWQRPQQRGIDDAEHGRARTNRKRQRRDDDSRDHWAVSQIAHGVPHVLTDGLEPDQHVRVACVFMRAQPPAKPQFGVVPRLVGRHAGFNVVARSLLDMELQFSVDLGVKAAAAENVDQAFSPCHAYPAPHA